MRNIVIIAHDIRSTHNVGSLMRTAEGLGIKHMYFSGYTAYPQFKGDTRLPHISAKLTHQIHKTALGAEDLVPWTYEASIETCVAKLKAEGFQIVALEQTADSLPLPEFKPSEKVALVLGREVEGIEPEILKLCDQAVEIPMFGRKESFNVVQAAAITLYHLQFS
jgi:23S rRNA (guanosine2251-2'-O)-methyltransferase